MTDHDSPILSIVIPHHDRPRMLRELVSSIPSRADIEIIIVDDNSAHPPAGLPDTQAGLRVFSQPEDIRYAGAARNRGIKEARGSWICFADSDDLFDSSALNDLIDKLHRSGSDLIYTRSRSFRPDGEPGQRHLGVNSLLDAASRGDTNCLVQFYPPWAKFIRRSLLEEKGIRFETTRVSNDVIFSARLFLAAEIWEIFDGIVYAIREGNQSLTSDVRVDAITERLAVLRRYNALLRRHGIGQYSVPAFGQLNKICRKHPAHAVKLALITWKAGDPVFMTPRHIIKHARRFVARLRTPQIQAPSA